MHALIMKDWRIRSHTSDVNFNFISMRRSEKESRVETQQNQVNVRILKESTEEDSKCGSRNGKERGEKGTKIAKKSIWIGIDAKKIRNGLNKIHKKTK